MKVLTDGIRQAATAGRDSGLRNIGKPPIPNPYKRDSPHFTAWQRAYDAAGEIEFGPDPVETAAASVPQLAGDVVAEPASNQKSLF